MNESRNTFDVSAIYNLKSMEAKSSVTNYAFAGLPAEGWLVLLFICFVICTLGAHGIRQLRKRRPKPCRKQPPLSLISLMAGPIVGAFLCIFIGRNEHPPLSQFEFGQLCVTIMVFASFAGTLQAAIIYAVCERGPTDAKDLESTDPQQTPIV
jgi:hypothetical protein